MMIGLRGLGPEKNVCLEGIANVGVNVFACRRHRIVDMMLDNHRCRSSAGSYELLTTPKAASRLASSWETPGRRNLEARSMPPKPKGWDDRERHRT